MTDSPVGNNHTMRLKFIKEQCLIDGFAHIEKDLYDYALEVAAENDRNDPSEEDEFNGFRRMVDAAIQSGA